MTESQSSFARPVPGFSLLTPQGEPDTSPMLSHVPDFLPCGTPIWAAPKAAIGAAERNRLVEAAKCPTPRSAELEARHHRDETRIRGHVEFVQWVRERGGDPAELHRPPVRLLPEPLTFAKHGQRYSLIGADMATGELVPGTAPRPKEGGEAAFTVISRREWSDEYRIRTHVEQAHALPPEQAGDRITHHLSERGARTLADSCHFMHVKRGGYRTFLTLTLDEAGRSRVEIRKADGPACGVTFGGARPKSDHRSVGQPGGRHWVDQLDLSHLSGAAGDYTPIEWDAAGRPAAAATLEAGDDVTYQTIQKEISRFMDGLQKMKTRGWTGAKTYPWGRVTCYGKDGQPVGEPESPVIGLKKGCALMDKRLKLIRQPVGYCWVVENPFNERGQRNPHIHLLMDWRVKYSAFGAWAARIEQLWGQGFAHLEKIKDPELAGGYLAKAAGYLSKAAGASDQGPVKGNRYGVGAYSRATAWECIGRYELSIMGHLIKDVADYFTHLYGHVYRKRQQLKAKLDETPKGDKGTRQRIGRTLSKVRGALARLPARANPYQLIIHGTERAREFWRWATTPAAVAGSDWLPAKDHGDQWQPDAPKPTGAWLHEFQSRLFFRKAGRRWVGLTPAHYEQWYEPDPEPIPGPDLFDWLTYEAMNYG